MKADVRTWLKLQREGVSVHVRVSVVAELPGCGEGRQGPEVEGQVLAHQVAVHLPGGTSGAGRPLKHGRAARRLRQQHRSAVARGVVAGELYGGSAFARSWRRRKTRSNMSEPKQDRRKRHFVFCHLLRRTPTSCLRRSWRWWSTTSCRPSVRLSYTLCTASSGR